MKPQYRDIMKHSGVYGLGQLLSRVASVLLLPLYTRHLTPADYGIIAILDLTVGVFAILIGGGVTAALSRYHFDADGEDAEHEVWWTGLIAVTVLATITLVPLFVVRGWLARSTLGTDESIGGYFYALALPNLWWGVIGTVPNQYLRVRKWSWLFVQLMFAGLLLNVALNAYFLVVLQMSVAGVLAGNLITGVVLGACRVAILIRCCGRPRFRWAMAVDLWRFGGPIILTALLALFMHYADRYLLRMFVSLDQVGIYSLAYTIGQGLNALVLVPFSAIWGVVIYDLAKEPDAKRAFARAFEMYVYVLLLFLFGVSLFIGPLLGMFAPAEYSAAAGLVPIVCLSFVFFSLDEHFRVPALLAKRTANLVPAYAIGTAVNIALNVLLIPRYGMAAAAWVSVATYATFAGVCLLQCRRIDRFEYPLARCAQVLCAMVATFLGCRYVQTFGVIWSMLAPAAVWIAWAAFLLYPTVRQQLRMPRLATVDLRQ